MQKRFEKISRNFRAFEKRIPFFSFHRCFSPIFFESEISHVVGSSVISFVESRSDRKKIHSPARNDCTPEMDFEMRNFTEFLRKITKFRKISRKFHWINYRNYGCWKISRRWKRSFPASSRIPSTDFRKRGPLSPSKHSKKLFEWTGNELWILRKVKAEYF